MEAVRKAILDAGAETVLILPETMRLMVWVKPDALDRVKLAVRRFGQQVTRETERDGELFFRVDLPQNAV